VDINQVLDRFQMELIELSQDNILKSLFNAKKDPIEVWKNAVEQCSSTFFVTAHAQRCFDELMHPTYLST